MKEKIHSKIVFKFLRKKREGVKFFSNPVNKYILARHVTRSCCSGREIWKINLSNSIQFKERTDFVIRLDLLDDDHLWWTIREYHYSLSNSHQIFLQTNNTDTHSGNLLRFKSFFLICNQTKPITKENQSKRCVFEWNE